MKIRNSNNLIVYNCINLFVMLCGAVLFAVLFPNFVFPKGLGFLASVALIPIAILLQRTSTITSMLWGFLYGFCAYLLFNIWLGTFSPVAFLIVPPIYGGYFIFVFLALKIVQNRFPKYGFLVQALLWTVYEYARTNGFLGYSFGTLGYAWSFYPLLIQSADLFGVWGLTFFISCSSFFLAQVYRDYRASAEDNANLYFRENPNTSVNLDIGSRGNVGAITAFVYRLRHILKARQYKCFLYLYGLTALVFLAYGFVAPKNYEDSPKVRIALIQHSQDPWKGGFIAYKTSLEKLIAESRKVLKDENPPELVVWSETSFVPSITYHLKYREVPEYTRLIKELKAFLAEYPDTEFLIGNGEGVRVTDSNGLEVRKNYNATLFFQGDKLQEQYYKMHLVPFTEYFPYEAQMPRFFAFLAQNDVHFWLAGDEYTVFESKKVKFSTPICFEDGFGLQNAKFVRAGAEILVNVTNDAWSHVEINAMQHLQMSIFRAVENRRSMVRSTNSGMTAVIDPNGHILEMLDSFTVGSILRDVSIYTESSTIYTKFGDWFVYVLMIALVSMIVAKFTQKQQEKSKKHLKKHLKK